MTKTNIDIQFYGEGFSPKKLKKLTHLPLEILVETGEIAKVGRYKNQKSPYGIALLKLSDTENILLEWSKKLIAIKDLLIQSKVEEIIFELTLPYKKSSNYTITDELSDNLSILNARINFNTI